jgi:hypothetical protein
MQCYAFLQLVMDLEKRESMSWLPLVCMNHLEEFFLLVAVNHVLSSFARRSIKKPQAAMRSLSNPHSLQPQSVLNTFNQQLQALT